MSVIIAINHLSIEARGIWDRLRSEFKLEFHHLVILRICLKSFDHMSEAREKITENGAFYKSGTLTKKNPALDVEKEAFNRFITGWKAIGLNLEIPKEVGRPPGT
ncbi:MAG TPA: hypothetical protein ENI15_14720 [Spirochaetes bacterium]|nr:hypothetical protein [Spirochaetota bacterium]